MSDKDKRGGYRGAAKEIISEFGVKNKTENSKKIVKFFKSMDVSGGITFGGGGPSLTQDAQEELKQVTKDLVNDMVMGQDSQAADDLKALRRDLASPLYLSKQDRGDIADFSSYARSGDNIIKFTTNRNRISVDQKYQELSSRYPHLFGRANTPSDQVREINEVASMLKRARDGEKLPREYKQMAANELIPKLLAGYLNYTKRNVWRTQAS